MSKALATIVTQPLIVAKVGLQSRPPAIRNGKPFKSFIEVMKFIIEHEGPAGLFKGIGPQILKGLLVQGILMMTKERYVLERFYHGAAADFQQGGTHVCFIPSILEEHSISEFTKDFRESHADSQWERSPSSSSQVYCMIIICWSIWNLNWST